MNTMLAYLIEFTFYASIFGVSFALTSPLRLKERENRRALIKQKKWARGLVGHVVVPAVVLALSYAVDWGVGFAPDNAQTWMKEHALHFDAWISLWSVILLVRAVEGIVVSVFWAKGRNFPIPDLLLSILRAVVVLLAGFFILKEILGVNIAPLLASTALVTAVIGFALQGVLGNLLGGMSLHLVRSMVPGDWIAIEGVEGEVIETNWRETRLRTLAGHIMIVPNSRMASMVVNNMSCPNTLRRHSFHVGASYSDAPGEVIEELVQSALAVPEVLRKPVPSAVVTEYKDFGINYELRYWTTRYYDRVPVDGDVGRMVWYRFKRKGIEIPFPMSDKLLNDFMAVVYRQRDEPPEERTVEQMADDLMNSQFAHTLLSNEDAKAALSKNDYLELARNTRRVFYTRGETLFRQHDAGENCYILVKGKMAGEVLNETNEKTQHVFEMNQGALVGEMSLLTGLPRTATVVCDTDCDLIEISDAAFRQLLSLRPEIPERLAALAETRSAEIRKELDKARSARMENLSKQLTRRPLLNRFLKMIRSESSS